MTNHPTEGHATDLTPDELTPPAGHQLSARNDPSMRDGNSGRGNPNEYPPNEESSDRDVGDTAEEAGVLDAVPAHQARRPEADPAAHAGLNPTAGVDRELDARGTAASPNTGRKTGGGGEFAVTVGDNSPEALEADLSPDDEYPAGGDTPARPRADSDTRAVAADHGESADPNLPIANYRQLTVKQIVTKLNDLPEDEVRRIRDYERAHRRRKTLMVRLERRLQGGGGNRRSDGEQTSRSAAHTRGRGG